MSVQIRNAGPSDLDALALLNAQAQSIHTDLFPDTFRTPDVAAVTDWFSKQLADEAISILLAEKTSRPVAYLVLRMVRRDSNPFCQARSSAYIDQICVTAELRGQGIARALIEQAKRLARAQGMTRLELDVWSQNHTAKRAHHPWGSPRQI